jgi:hypothetical protein
MDELGLAVVDELGLDLRRLLRGSLDIDEPLEVLVGQVVDGYQRYVGDNPDLVQFVNQARTGASERLRVAIAHELDFFVTRVAGVLPDILPGLKPNDRDTVAQLLLALLLESTAETLALPEGNDAKASELREGLEQRIWVVVLGAQRLADAKPARPVRAARKVEGQR